MIDFDKEYNKKLNENIQHLKNNINNSDYTIKIINFCKKFNFDFDIVKNKIINDDIFASFFVKDPAKQNLYENIVANYISNIDNVKNFKNLSNNVKLFVVDGMITEKRNNDVKSIDFYFEYNLHKFYVSHKFIREEGGAQDNQYNDIKNFLKNCKNNNYDNVIFIALCDGEYFNNRNRYVSLISEYQTNNIKILTSNNIEEFLLSI